MLENVTAPQTAIHTMPENVLSGFSRPPLASNWTTPTPQSLVPGCAVVVCTYMRAASLNRFLDSLSEHDRRPDQLIIVDASIDDSTERSLRQRTDLDRLSHQLIYWRVAEPLRGLTRQRNFALTWVSTDLVAFFDDDIVLRPGCLATLEKVHRTGGDNVVGVAAFIENQIDSRMMTLYWRIARLLYLVPALQPGRYYHSGISIPWNALQPTEAAIEGDWLQGGVAMWKTVVPLEIGFLENFHGYGLGEDLEFSLRARQKGKLLLAGAAHVLHFHDPAGRPNYAKLGYMEIYNKYAIHRRALPQHTLHDKFWFVYAWSVDTLLLARHFIVPQRWGPTLKQVMGRFRAAADILRGR